MVISRPYSSLSRWKHFLKTNILIFSTMVGPSRDDLLSVSTKIVLITHDDVITWKCFPYYWLFVRGKHLLPVDSPNKGPVTRTLNASLIFVWLNRWLNCRVIGDFRHHVEHVTSSPWLSFYSSQPSSLLRFIPCPSRLTIPDKEQRSI